MTIRAKISVLAFALLALLAVVGGIALDGLSRIHGELKSLHRDVLPLDTMIEQLVRQEIEREAALYAALRASLRAGPRDTGTVQGETNQLIALLNAEAEAVDGLIGNVSDHGPGVEHPEIASLLAAPSAALVKQAGAFTASARALANALGASESKEADRAFDDFTQEVGGFRDALDALSDTMRQSVNDAAARAEEHEARIQQMVLIAALLALGAGIVGTVVISGLITRPIRDLVAAARRIETGALDVAVEPHGSDEMAGLGRTFNTMVEGLRTKERIKETFGKYIDPRIIQDLIGETSLLDSSRRTMTVSLARYDGFAEFAENRPPEEIVERINQFYTAMAQQIADRNGVVDKMAGDRVLAFFGSPFTAEEGQAELACLAALDQALWRPEAASGTHRPRIAIASEASIVGNMGSEQIRSFTIMGDNVALAEAMLSVSGDYDAAILITGATRTRLAESIVTRHLDNVLLPGRDDPVVLYEVLGRAGEVPEADIAFADTYNQALSAYLARDFDRARAIFEICAEERPEDAATAILLQRLDMIEMDPPEDDWSGAWRLTA
jgi:class 3 adenylate cyclase